jgi:hypothetical protein
MHVNPPWDDCKVAFGIDYNDDDRALWDMIEAAQLPAGWSLNEIDGASTRVVVVFRVEGLLQVEDGKRVAAILSEITGSNGKG